VAPGADPTADPSANSTADDPRTEDPSLTSTADDPRTEDPHLRTDRPCHATHRLDAVQSCPIPATPSRGAPSHRLRQRHVRARLAMYRPSPGNLTVAASWVLRTSPGPLTRTRYPTFVTPASPKLTCQPQRSANLSGPNRTSPNPT
jgi:hypothetical protein